MPPYTRSIGRVLLILLFGWSLSGCALIPETRTQPSASYILTLEPPQAGWPSCAQSHGVLVVSTPREQAGLDSNGIAYLMRPHEIKFYAYNHWAESPARMLLPLIIQAMEKTGCWTTVAYADSGLRGNFRLDSEILAWQQEFFSNPSRLRLSFRVHLIDPQNRRVLDARRFELAEPAPSDNAYGAVLASNQAVNRWLRELAGWMVERLGAASAP